MRCAFFRPPRPRRFARPGRDAPPCAVKMPYSLPDEIPGVGVVWLPDGEEDARPVAVLFRERAFLFVPYLLRQAEHRPALRPADIHGGVGDDGRDLLFRYAMGFRVFEDGRSGKNP